MQPKVSWRTLITKWICDKIFSQLKVPGQYLFPVWPRCPSASNGSHFHWPREALRFLLQTTLGLKAKCHSAVNLMTETWLLYRLLVSDRIPNMRIFNNKFNSEHKHTVIVSITIPISFTLSSCSTSIFASSYSIYNCGCPNLKAVWHYIVSCYFMSWRQYRTKCLSTILFYL